MKIQKKQSLKAFNSFGIDVTAEYFTEIKHTNDFTFILDWLNKHEQTFLLIGGGSNILFTKDYNGLAIVIKTQGKQLIDEDESHYYVEAQAGENWHNFVRWTIAQGYAGLENLSLIPGTVGAAPMQNIGAYGIELADRFHSLKAIDIKTGEQKEFDKESCDFGYRHSFFKENLGQYIIQSVTFKLAKQAEWKINYAGVRDALEGKTLSAKLISDTIISIRQSKLPSPDDIGNAGSFFKNPIIDEISMSSLRETHPHIPCYPLNNGRYKTSAAWLIDQCGWKGKKLGKAGVYPNHALVLTNLGNATGNEIWHLAHCIIASVEDKFGISLEPEPRVI